MRIVLDTNILVSALISREGPPGQLLAEVKRGGLRLVTSTEQIAELGRVFRRPHLARYIAPADADDLLRNLAEVGEVVTELPILDDNRILAVAVGRADLVVSGDKNDMLALGNVEGIPIVTAARAAAATRRRPA